MSAKWRALQRRHKWTYDSVILPSSFMEALHSIPPSFSNFTFFDELRNLSALTSIHAQVAACKKVVSSFSELVVKSDTNDALLVALPMYVEILFQENSLPLHRNLLSVFSHHFPFAHQSLVKDCFHMLCKEYGLQGSKFRRFGLVTVASSILSVPKAGFLKQVVEQCSTIMALNICNGMQSVLKEISVGSHPSPSTMEQCQDAMSSLYYLLQQFPHKFTLQNLDEDSIIGPYPQYRGQSIYEIAVSTICDVLKSSAFSRDCMLAAGVGFCAAAQIRVNPHLSLFLSNAIFSQTGIIFGIISPDQGIAETSDQCWLEAAVMKLYKRDLASEVEQFTDFGRLCLLRGILTAIPRPVLNTNLVLLSKHLIKEHSELIDTSKDGVTEDHTVWTILFDGILLALCNLCESSVDSHFNFHAVTALQICLQQIKASLLSQHVTVAEEALHNATKLHGISVKPYHPFTEVTVNRVLKIIWNNWEDPLNQTVKQVQVVFELLIDIQSLFSKIPKQRLVEMNVEAELEEKNLTRAFLHRIASELLLVGGHRKGRYVPLAILSQRLGASSLLSMSPKLLFETVQAYMDDDVCCAATSFLKCFLERLREDCWSSEGAIGEGYSSFRRLWIPPILSGLVSGVAKIRSNLSTYALPVVLQIDDDGIFTMLAFIFNGETLMNSILSWHELEDAVGLPGALTVDQKVAATISLLKVARSLALLEGDIDWYRHTSELSEGRNGPRQEYMDGLGGLAVVHVKGLEVHVPVDWLKHALTHMDDSLRIDVAELLFLNPKTSSLVSTLELNLMRIAIPLNMRCSSMAFRMKWTSLFKKYFLRVRTALERHVKQAAHKLHVNSSCHDRRDGLQSGFVLMNNHGKNENINMLELGVRDLDLFMKWLSRFLVFSLYPSAPYERKSMAMELFLVMIDVWHVNQLPTQENSQYALSSSVGTCYYYPYDEGLLLADFTLVVVGAIVDSWDKLRENSFKILLQFPAPIPGISSTEAVKEVIIWAKSLVSSPRVRESDAGALTLRLIFRKYVQELGWTIKIHEDYVSESQLIESHALCNGVANAEKSYSRAHNIGNPVGEYIQSLIYWLNAGIEEGEKNLLKACKHSFVHGILLTLRYTIEELNWTSDTTRAGAPLLQLAIERLLGLVVRVTSLALWVVSSDALDMAENIDSFIEDIHSNQSLLGDGKEPHSVNSVQEEDVNGTEGIGPANQVVMVGCWLAMKELSLLLGTITRKAPLPGTASDVLDASLNIIKTGKLVDNAQQCGSFGAMLDVKQLEIIGDHFLQVLLAMKHNGAIDKTRAGFTALCNRLLCSSDPRLNQMPESWMKQLMQRTISKDQTVDDLLRRSAGIPAAFSALFLAEPEATPKKLLPLAMRWLMELAKSFLSKLGNLIGYRVLNNDCSSMDEENELQSTEPDARPMEVGDSQNFSKQRDEGVVPAVHAFNALKVTFNDTNLSTDTSGFCAEALIISIRAFSCHYWEVRNSATLAFTALVHRMIGFLNEHNKESARRAMTGFEFFHRYPTLHPFLLEELQNATRQLQQSVSQYWRDNKLGRSLHPSLSPILIILSRLKPSIVSSGTEDWLNPSEFVPYIRNCATQCNLRVRILASKALAPLVSRNNLLNMLLDIANGLPNLGLGSLCPSNRQPISFNFIHGILLQISSLLRNNCMIIPDVIEKEQIVNALLPVLETCSELGSVKLCACPMVISAYMQVLEDLLKIAGTCHKSTPINKIESMLMCFSSECLDASAVYRSELYDSTRVDLRQRAVAFYLNTVMEKHLVLCMEGPRRDSSMHHLMPSSFPSCYNLGSTDSSSRYENSSSFLERLKGCLSDSTYEVRLTSLKVLYQFIKSLESENISRGFDTFISSVQQWLQTNLQAILLERLELETNPKCLRRNLQVLYLCNSLEVLNSSSLKTEEQMDLCWADNQAVLDLWAKLVTIQGTARHAKTKEALILCFGSCIKHLVKFIKYSLVSGIPYQEVKNDVCQMANFEKSYQWSKTCECISSWSVLIKKYSDPCEPVNMRSAIAEGIVASGLLEEASWIGPIISNEKHPFKMKLSRENSLGTVEAQSEGMDLFSIAILDTWFTCIKLLEDEDINLRQKLAVAVVKCMSSSQCNCSNVEIVVPTQVEKVLELCFDFLTASFACWLVYFDRLANWVLGSEDYLIFMTSADMVRRLFDKELDNHHEERLLISQLCCLHLQRLLNGEIFGSGFQGAKISSFTSFVDYAQLNSMEEIEPFIHTWRMKFLSKLISFAKHCIGIVHSITWVGGITNHQDVFKVIYPCLLGLYAFACHPLGKEHHDSSQSNCRKELLCHLTELTELMLPLLLNPLIANLYIKVLQAYENQLTIDLGSKDLQTLKVASSCQDFDPYFLLK